MRLALLFSFLVACDPASPAACEEAAEIPGVLEIGTGESDYEPVSDGDDVKLAYGPQGGQHVWGSLRAEGIVSGLLADDDADPVVDFEVIEADGDVLGGYRQTPRHFDGALAGELELVGDTLILDWLEEGFEGLEVTIAAHLVDACGRELSAERAVTLRE